jgi:hypothetical protein
MSDGVAVMGKIGFGAERRWKILRSFWKKLTEVGKKRSEGLFCLGRGRAESFGKKKLSHARDLPLCLMNG